MPHWWDVITCREYEAWTTSDLEHAANLTRVLWRMECVWRDIQVEPDTVPGASGNMVLNPKHKLLESLTSRSVLLSRLLHIHANATEGPSRDQVPRSVKQREMAAKASGADNLISKPH